MRQIFRREAIPRKWISRAKERRNDKERAMWFDQAAAVLKAKYEARDPSRVWCSKNARD